MVDHREYKGPGEAQAEAKGAEKAESNSRRLWIVLFIILVVPSPAVPYASIAVLG